MDPRHSSIRLFRKAASELLCKHALVLVALRLIGWCIQRYLKVVEKRAEEDMKKI
jgi:hypothetical protein